jgi:hypothetical protein
MRQIVGSTLMRARYLQSQMSQRNLARGVATQLGRPSAASALQKAISRAELAPNPSSLPGEVVSALELELELEPGDLGYPYRWAYRLTGLRGSEDRLAWLSGCLPVFSAAVNAYEARGWVTFGDGRVIRELEFAHPYEIFHAELHRALDGDWSRAILDPPYPDFMRLAGRPLAA